MRVLFVCLGNICRSPTAEAVARRMAAERGLAATIESAGTGDWHVGEPRDPRMAAAAARRGYPLSGRARQVEPADFHRFELVVAMDRKNLRDLEALRPSGAPAELVLLRSYEPTPADPDVPDPYYGGPEGFDEVVTIVERCVSRLLSP